MAAIIRYSWLAIPAAAAAAACLPSPCAALTDGDLPTIISAGTDHAIKRWDSSGKLIDTLATLDDAVNVVVVMHNGALASGSADGRVSILNIADGHQTQSLQVSRAAILSIAVSPDEMLLAVGSADGKISLWDPVKGRRLSETQAHGGAVAALKFTSGGALLISGSADNTVRIWRVIHKEGNSEAGALEYKSSITAHDDAVTCMVVSPGDGLLATVSQDGWLKTWRLDGGLVARVKACDRGAASAAFSPDGRTIAVGDNEGRVRLFSTQALTPYPMVFMHDRDRPVYALAWTENGKVLVSAGADKTIRYWSIETGRKIKSIAAHDGDIRCLALAP